MSQELEMATYSVLTWTFYYASRHAEFYLLKTLHLSVRVSVQSMNWFVFACRNTKTECQGKF